MAQKKKPRSFAKALFAGRIPEEMIFPYPELDKEEGEMLTLVLDNLRKFAENQIDSAAIDREGKLPDHVLGGLKEMGLFGLQATEEYGGLGLSQSAVSFHIDKLEEELGVQLFNRQGRTISLTVEGRILFQELEQLERVARRVENNFAFHSNILGRRIRVGSNALACPFTLPWVIQGFKN